MRRNSSPSLRRSPCPTLLVDPFSKVERGILVFDPSSCVRLQELILGAEDVKIVVSRGRSDMQEFEGLRGRIRLDVASLHQ